MVFLTSFSYPNAVSYINMNISLGPGWRSDICRVKVQSKTTNAILYGSCNLYIFKCPVLDAPKSTHDVFMSFSYASAVI